jgi:hypothetical protein
MGWRKMAERNLAAQSAGSGHELRDLPPARIALFGVALAVIIVSVLFITYALFQRFQAGETRARPLPSPLSYSQEPTPEPRLEVNPGVELKTMRAEEDEILKSYDWIDRDRGIVRMPIDRAIDVLAEKGLPVRAAEKDELAGAKPNPAGRKEKQKR